MKKSLLSLVAASILAVPVMAEEVKVKKDPKAASFTGMFKLMHIVDGAYTGTTSPDNKFDPSTGSAALINVKYKTKTTNNLSAVMNHYTLVDTGLTDYDGITAGTQKLASGMFIEASGTEQAPEFSILGEAYLNYGAKTSKAKVGRQLFKTPLTKIKFSTLPSFFNGLSYTNTASKDLKISAAHMTQMAMGARSLADSKLIGENTGTAGAVKSGLLQQGVFLNMAEVAGVDSTNTAGMTVLGADYTGMKGLNLKVWDYYIDGMANNAYLEATYKYGLSKSLKLVVGGQYLTQAYDATAVGVTTGTSNFSMMGAKLGIKSPKKFSFCAAMNQSSGDAFVNVWGADPGYTSTIFSRNEYRKNVTAMKYSASYTIAKGFKLMVAHANYGKSETVGGLTSTSATNDATETDIVVVYKPNKEWMFKLFNAQRTSEYEKGGFDWSQNHTRFVGTYKF